MKFNELLVNEKVSFVINELTINEIVPTSARRYGHLTFVSECPTVHLSHSLRRDGHPRDHAITSFQEVLVM